MLAKAPKRKRAEQYLAASGAVPIIIERDQKEGTLPLISIITGKITGNAAAR
jgi:hypothetical protein